MEKLLESTGVAGNVGEGGWKGEGGGEAKDRWTSRMTAAAIPIFLGGCDLGSQDSGRFLCKWLRFRERPVPGLGI